MSLATQFNSEESNSEEPQSQDLLAQGSQAKDSQAQDPQAKSKRKPLRLIYAGTPEFSVPALQALHAAGYEIVAVLTQPDRPAGRGQKLKSSPVKQAALALGLDVWQPLSLRKAEIKKRLRAVQADALIVAAYGLILPQSVLDLPRLACINIHASLLPRWRGAAPIHRAIEAGDAESGITIMQMDAGLDTGDMLSVHPIPIAADDTSQSLHDKLSELGASAIVNTLKCLEAHTITAQVQDASAVTYAHKLHKSEALMDWNESVEIIERKIRAFNPWPCAFTRINLSEKNRESSAGQGAPEQEIPEQRTNLRIWRAQILSTQALPRESGFILACNSKGMDVQTGKGVLRILELQLAGRKRMSIEQFANAHDFAGKLLA